MTYHDGSRGGPQISRRRLLAMFPPLAAAVVGAGLGSGPLPGFTMLRPAAGQENPLEQYPDRDWERVYRDLYTPDSQFHYLCAPNDTHGCLLKANVKNGVVVYADPSFGYQHSTDVYGNRASGRWDPRACISGLSYVRRFYSDRRIKGPMVRQGFKRWAEAGFPRDPSGLPPEEYRAGRGKEEFESVTWDEAWELVARGLVDIATTYSGPEGADLLKEQDYDPAMIEAMHEAGTSALKARGGMPLIQPIRTAGLYRFQGAMTLLDAHVRGTGPEDAVGGRHWDSYSWHTDLPPGHPMVTGQQTLDFDLYTAENARLITLWGKNWIATKMPDGHWLTEAKLHGAKVVTIAPEYQSSSSKADDVIVIRPGTDSALSLGLAQVIIAEGLYDEDFVKRSTDLPLLVRMDTHKLLRAADVDAAARPATLTNMIHVLESGETPPGAASQEAQYVKRELREQWGDFAVWDASANAPRAVTRDQVGRYFAESGIEPALEGEFDVTLSDGSTVKARPVFDLVKQYLDDSCTPPDIAKVTWAPEEAIVSLARMIAANPAATLFVEGMGPNHFFNNDIKDRTIILVAALTNNVGHFGGTVGSYAGNYRLSLFSGIGQWISENPFDIELDAAAPARTKSYYSGESAHYYNYGDRPLRVGNKMFTGNTHMPTPTKTAILSNSNSILGNAKWAYNVIVNTLPKIEMIVVSDWFWTASCEYADIVLAADPWHERKKPDIYAAVTNPFLQSWPRSPLPRTYDTRDDMESWAGISDKLAEITGDRRFRDYWQFVHSDEVEVYIDRVFQEGNATRGYSFAELDETSRNGTPLYLMTRTSPRIVGWEQTNESKPWYNQTGRLEFYREEDEFIEYGENLPVHREPSDGTPHEPNIIMAAPHPSVSPKSPEDYGLTSDDLSSESRQVRNVILTPAEVVASTHPLIAQGFSHVLITPKYRHACHTTGASTDLDVVMWGPFGDFYRHDKRTPWVSEGYIDLNPADAVELGFEDGDYVWCDGDPQDRPFIGHADRPDDMKVMRWLVRVRYYPSIARGIGRAWFHFYIGTHGSVEGHETRPDALAKNPRTGYQAGYRYGSHQSITRAWLRPTLQTDTLVRKDPTGQTIGTGFALDVHCTVGAPKESFVKLEKAEDGGIGGEGLWHPAAEGYRPGYENEAMIRYLDGTFIEKAG
jgi:nitrate reductase / nitrite oxidoreductase, alpha subunit